MNTKYALGLILCAGMLTGPALAQVEITSYDQTGVLEWSNALPNAQAFDVEWTGALTGGVWQGNWEGLEDIPATAATYRVSVPSCYRVVARTNVMRSRWTLLYYMMADNNLEPDFLRKFVTLGIWNSDTNVQQVVQLGRMGTETQYGEWAGCERFVITTGITPTQGNAIQDWGDGQGGRMVNMSDPDSLADFLQWAMARYPADHVGLVIGDHGFGWTGFGISESYGDSFLYLSDLRAVLQNSPSPVDCLFLDACVMSMAETIVELGQTDLQTVLASETFGECDWPYGWLLTGLQGSPDWTPRQFATDYNDRLWTYYSASNPVPKITLCTTDLVFAPALASNMADFVSGVLDTNVPLAEVQNRARTAMGTISNAFLVQHMGSYWAGIAHGLSVNFPLKEGLYLPPLFAEYMPRRALFSGDAQWRSLLEAFYDPMSHPPYHSQLNDARNAITNYLDGDEGKSYIDLIDLLGRFADAPS
jgi:Clostripain family